MPLISKQPSFIIDFIKKEIYQDDSLHGQLVPVPYFTLSSLPPSMCKERANWEATPIYGTPEMLIAFDKAVDLAKQQFDLESAPLGASAIY